MILRRERQTGRPLYFQNFFRVMISLIPRVNLLLAKQVLLPPLEKTEIQRGDMTAQRDISIKCQNKNLLLQYFRTSSCQCVVSGFPKSIYRVHNAKNNFGKLLRYYLPFPLCWHLYYCCKHNGGCICCLLTPIKVVTPNCISIHHTLHHYTE